MRNIRKNSTDIKGRPVTTQRQLLLDLIKRAGGHITAKELYTRAVGKNRSISLATVYRNLRLFKSWAWLRRGGWARFTAPMRWKNPPAISI